MVVRIPLGRGGVAPDTGDKYERILKLLQDHVDSTPRHEASLQPIEAFSPELPELSEPLFQEGSQV